MLLGVLIQLSLSFGVAFVNSDAILLIVLMMKLAFSFAGLMLLLGPRGMGLFIFSFSLLMNLVFSGILSKLVGFGLVFPSAYDDWAYSAFS